MSTWLLWLAGLGATPSGWTSVRAALGRYATFRRCHRRPMVRMSRYGPATIAHADAAIAASATSAKTMRATSPSHGRPRRSTVQR